MGDNAFLSPVFIILVIAIIGVVFWLVTRAKKKAQQEVSGQSISTTAGESSRCMQVAASVERQRHTQKRSPAGR
ncbi:hypothetical protein [Xanthomonas populi]|uniref:hypothetical protein n=1 Tax=Xanthomonas populi TaxID=53414 RepID=UPI000FF88377|nr:hypothetical protein [Xanthomonas populi]